MTESKTYQLTCPHCSQTIPVEIGVSKEAYKEESRPSATITRTVEDVVKALPQDVLPNLNVALNKHDSKTIHITPKKYLGKENFYKVSKAVKAMHGEWVSQGKHSYWWVPAVETVEV
jgi:hypothetical protein